MTRITTLSRGLWIANARVFSMGLYKINLTDEQCGAKKFGIFQLHYESLNFLIYDFIDSFSIIVIEIRKWKLSVVENTPRVMLIFIGTANQQSENRCFSFCVRIFEAKVTNENHIKAIKTEDFFFKTSIYPHIIFIFRWIEDQRKFL